MSRSAVKLPARGDRVAGSWCSGTAAEAGLAVGGDEDCDGDAGGGEGGRGSQRRVEMIRHNPRRGSILNSRRNDWYPSRRASRRPSRHHPSWNRMRKKTLAARQGHSWRPESSPVGRKAGACAPRAKTRRIRGSEIRGFRGGVQRRATAPPPPGSGRARGGWAGPAARVGGGAQAVCLAASNGVGEGAEAAGLV